VWTNFSTPKSFYIINVKPGAWSGRGTALNVTRPTTSGAFVAGFTVYIYVRGCGPYKVTKSKAPLLNRKFSFGNPLARGSFYANGIFSSMKAVSGALGFHYYHLPGCGTIIGGPFRWGATWKNDPKLAIDVQKELIPIFSEPWPSALDTGAYTVERVSP